MIYSVEGRLLNGMESMSVGSEAFVSISRVESKWFNIESQMRIGYVMSPSGMYVNGAEEGSVQNK